MNTKIQAKKGDIILYENRTFQNTYYGVVVSRNDHQNGFDVVRLTPNGQPFIMAYDGVHFDIAFDDNIKIVYQYGLKNNGEKVFPNY